MTPSYISEYDLLIIVYASFQETAVLNKLKVQTQEQINRDIQMLSSGNTDIIIDQKYLTKRDEIGDVFNSFDRYLDTVKEVGVFAEEIGKGIRLLEFFSTKG